MKENSLQYLSKIYPQSTNDQLFDTCHRGCVELLEDCQEALKVQFVSDGLEEKAEDNGVNGKDEEEAQRRRSKVKESKVCRDMMAVYSAILKGHLKTTINYTSLQQAHNGMVEEHKRLKEEFAAYKQYDDDNSLEADALIMASMTTALF